MAVALLSVVEFNQFFGVTGRWALGQRKVLLYGAGRSMLHLDKAMIVRVPVTLFLVELTLVALVSGKMVTDCAN